MRFYGKLEIASKKETSYSRKGQNLLASVDTKTSSPFHGMIARTNSYGFTEIFLTVFPLRFPL